MITAAQSPEEREAWQRCLRLLPGLESLGVEEAIRRLSPRGSQYWPFRPHPTQAAFLALDQLEALYGGAGGGGKSFALLMAALQYVDVPGYDALILRRTYQQLSKPNALMDLATEWLSGTSAKWNGETHTWRFPAGSTLSFGHLEHENSKYDYQGPSYNCICFDELTQFTESQYTYLFSRLRRGAGVTIPARMRAASNPGGVGHAWVKDRFISVRKAGRVFLPAKIADNPSLDIVAYRESLAELDPVTRAQIEEGDWDAFAGGRFQAAWFRRYWTNARGFWCLETPGGVQVEEPTLLATYTICDPAASEKETADNTAIGTFSVTALRDLIVLEVSRKKLNIDAIVPAILTQASRWKSSYVGIEGTGFQVGIVNQAKRTPGMPPVRALEPAGKGKLVRATPAIVAAHAGQIYLPTTAPWKADFLAELTLFTGDEKQDAHDDQVDVLAYAVQERDRSTFTKFDQVEQPGPRKLWDRQTMQEAAERLSSASRRGFHG